MKNFILIILAVFAFSGAFAKKKSLDNTFYVFNNGVKTLPNSPETDDEQARLAKDLGFDGVGGHYRDDYFPRRASLEKYRLKLPEIYLPLTIKEDGSASFSEDIYDIIKDSKNKDLMISLAVFSDYFMDKKEEGDKYLVKAVRELADFAAPYGVKVAVYPHLKFYCERLDHSIRIAKMVDRPNVGAIFNTCHLFKVEGMENWQQKLVDAIPYLYMISINGIDEGDTQNMGWDRLIRPLGEGSFDTYQLVKLAKDNGYNGMFGLQCYNIRQDCTEALTKSINTWKAYQAKYKKDRKTIR